MSPLEIGLVVDDRSAAERGATRGERGVASTSSAARPSGAPLVISAAERAKYEGVWRDVLRADMTGAVARHSLTLLCRRWPDAELTRFLAWDWAAAR